MKKAQALIFILGLCLSGLAMQVAAQDTSGQGKQDSSQPQSSAPQQPQVPENQAGQPTQTDVDKNAGSYQIEQKIQSAFQRDPNSAYSQVSVQSRENDIVLAGTVLNEKAKKDAENIARRYAGGRKIKNQIQVNKTNPTTAPGPGM